MRYSCLQCFVCILNTCRITEDEEDKLKTGGALPCAFRIDLLCVQSGTTTLLTPNKGVNIVYVFPFISYHSTTRKLKTLLPK